MVSVQSMWVHRTLYNEHGFLRRWITRSIWITAVLRKVLPLPPPQHDFCAVMDNEYSHAPWTDDQIASLNAYQNSGKMHPFTGRRADGSKTILIATTDGWVGVINGPILQTWAWLWMADWAWCRGKRSRKLL
jgi:hypothetical protein